MHCEKRRRRVWRSEILSVMEEISRSTALIRDVKKEKANETEPTGWLSRRNPDVSSTGRNAFLRRKKILSEKISPKQVKGGGNSKCVK